MNKYTVDIEKGHAKKRISVYFERCPVYKYLYFLTTVFNKHISIHSHP